MKSMVLIFLLSLSFTVFAQSQLNVEAVFTGQGKAASQVRWKDKSFTDWAGSVMLARLNVMAPTAGVVSGVVRFTYNPEPNLSAVALKQSSGADDIVIKGALDDFTDLEGRRIIALKPGQPITIEMPFTLKYTKVNQSQLFDVMIELEPTEYL